MPTQKKIDQVQDLKQLIEGATITMGADYRGLRVQEMNDMRRRLRQAGVQVRVIKNSLLRLAANEAGVPDLMQMVEGPTALVIGRDDPTEAAKALDEYARSAPPTFGIRGAFLDGAVLTAGDLKDFVRLPPKPVMLAQLAGQLQSPLTTFLGLIRSPIQEFSLLLHSTLSELPGLIDARARQLEASGAPPGGEPEAGPAPQEETPAAEEQPAANAEETTAPPEAEGQTAEETTEQAEEPKDTEPEQTE